MRARRVRAERIARQVVLTTGAAFGTVCIVITLLAVLAQVRPLIFRSGSMAPAIDTGAFAIAHQVDARDLRVGDIASVMTASGDRVSHRIVSAKHHQGSVTLRLKGDGNRVADAAPYVVDHADVVIFSVPWLGYVVGWIGSPLGLFVMGLYAAFFLSMLVRGAPDQARPRRPRGGRRPGGRHSDRGPSDGPPSHRGSRHRAVGRHRPGSRVLSPVARAMRSLPVAAGVPLAGVMVLHPVGPSFAAWSDPGQVLGTTQTAYTVPAPSGSSCQASLDGGDGVVVMSWSATSAPLPDLGYDTHVTGLASSTTSLDLVGGQQRLTVRYDTSVPGNQGQSVSVAATGHLTSTPSWTSTTATWTFTTAGSGQAPSCP